MPVGVEAAYQQTVTHQTNRPQQVFKSFETVNRYANDCKRFAPAAGDFAACGVFGWVVFMFDDASARLRR